MDDTLVVLSILEYSNLKFLHMTEQVFSMGIGAFSVTTLMESIGIPTLVGFPTWTHNIFF